MNSPRSNSITSGIRLAVPGDLAAIAVIVAESPTAPQWSAGEFAAMLADGTVTPLERIVLVCEDGGEVAGFAVYTLLRAVFPPDAELESLAVSAAHRRKGFAASLLHAVKTAAIALGAEMLSLEVRAGNAAAETLYREAGFNHVGIRRGYYSSPSEDAIFMQLPLTEPGGQASNGLLA